ELCVLTPDRWKHYGKWRRPVVIDQPKFRYEIGKVRWPWMGPAQFYLHYYPQLATLLREFQPDIIDLWEEPWGLVSAQACRLRNQMLPQTKIVCETEQNLEKTLPFPFERFRRYTLSNADFVIGRSDEAIEIVRRKGYRGPARMVPNGVDLDLFRPLDRDECRRKLNLNRFTLGYVGRLVEEKGLADLLEAMGMLGDGADLLLVGSGSFEASLRQKVNALKLDDRVRFVPACPLNELPVVMNALDVLVLPSRTTHRWKEQFGRVIVEAHACQTPVIGSDSGAIPNVIGEAGLVFPEANPSALAAAVRQLIDDPERKIRLGKLGRSQAERSCSWQRIAQQMVGIYADLLDEPGSATQFSVASA